MIVGNLILFYNIKFSVSSKGAIKREFCLIAFFIKVRVMHMIHIARLDIWLKIIKRGFLK
ncbi:hypothetical protein AWN73_16610 [Clostridium butyricum]|uniref:Uncharacterized protein n=1 Tax=Clostridium butyricum TaxID=1492 RepID=A0A2S7F6I7_CLOBU|nr:hypothetical protein OA81_19800 [Clostridium butyricum]PPV12457.1 hypothetical protein AWN73_18665 [Clostridium butyricum]PPV13332.1 hypothetical protein AWN73_16610 [Clostridium butyricum]